MNEQPQLPLEYPPPSEPNRLIKEAERSPLFQEIVKGRIVLPVRDENPAAGVHGWVVLVRDGGGLRLRAYDRNGDAFDGLGLDELDERVVELEDAPIIDGMELTDEDVLQLTRTDGADPIELDVSGLRAVTAVTQVRTLSVAAGDDTTDWQELSASLASDIYITAVSVRSDDIITGLSDHTIVAEVGTGAATSESAILTELPVGTAVAPATITLPSLAGYFPLSPTLKLPSGTRLAARLLSDDGAAINWGSGDEPQITVHYYTDDDVAD